MSETSYYPCNKSCSDCKANGTKECYLSQIDMMVVEIDQDKLSKFREDRDRLIKLMEKKTAIFCDDKYMNNSDVWRFLGDYNITVEVKFIPVISLFSCTLFNSDYSSHGHIDTGSCDGSYHFAVVEGVGNDPDRAFYDLIKKCSNREVIFLDIRDKKQLTNIQFPDFIS